ncbi:MAG: site-specific integrase [Thermodesulfobacteriota bacterium]|nr:site-specific integrase [Thermodesulfobacteriota bacterium]
MSKRIKTKYPGVFYREADRIGGRGTEKVYYVVYKKDNKVHEEKAGRQYADDMTPAKAAHYRAQLIEGKRLPRKAIKQQEQARKVAEAEKYTIDKLWEEYKANRAPGKGLEVDKYRYEKYIKPEFEKKEPRELVKLDVDRLRIRLLKKLSPQTVKHVLNLLTWIINYGVKNNLCEGISFHIQKPTVNNLKTEDLTADQLDSLMKAIDKSPDTLAANMMKLVLYTGMRRGECFRLKWKDIDFDRGFITLRNPKGGIEQKIPLNKPAHDLLKSHERIKGSEYVFPGRGGGQRKNIREPVNKIKKAAGLPKDFRALHGLRHVYASMLASSGKVDMYTLQKLLTHKSPVMTQRYAHLRDEALKNASDLAGDIITGVGADRLNVVAIKDGNGKG